MLYTQSSSVNSHYREFPVRSCLAVTGVSLAVVGVIILALAAVCAHYGYISTPGVVTKLFIGGGFLLFTSFIGFLSFARSKARKTKPVALSDQEQSPVDESIRQAYEFSAIKSRDDIKSKLALEEAEYQRLKEAIKTFKTFLDDNQGAKSEGNCFPLLCLKYLELVKIRYDKEQLFIIGQSQDVISIPYDGDCLFISFLVLVLQEDKSKKFELATEVLAMRKLIFEYINENYKEDMYLLKLLVKDLLVNCLAEQSELENDCQDQNQSVGSKRNAKRGQMFSEQKKRNISQELDDNITALRSIPNYTSYGTFLKETRFQKLLEAYFEEIQNSGTFGGKAAIYAASQLFGVSIVIRNTQNGKKETFPIKENLNSSGKKRDRKEVLEIVQNGNRFMPYIPELNCPKQNFI